MIDINDMIETLEVNGTESTIRLLISAIEELEKRVEELENLMNDNLVDVEMKADCNTRDIVKLNKKLTDYIPKTERFI